MRLVSLEARNYRTLENLKLDFSESYCTLSGRNNAGKSCVIRLLSMLFRGGSPYPWDVDEFLFSYKEDKTQWVKKSVPIEIRYTLGLTIDEDPALITFIGKIASIELIGQSISLTVSYSVSDNDILSISVSVGEREVDETAAKEIDKKIKDSNLLFLHNSTTPREGYYYGRGRRRVMYEFVMSEEEKAELEEASKHIERKLKRLAKEHTQGLIKVLGRLTESYDVELSTPEGYSVRRMPWGINLKDRHVEVPLGDWGSGTQNRTHVLMAILQANKIKTTAKPDEKITPFVVVEEPECFLHPSAQAEFGKILRVIAKDFGIQILVTTHSPYMLNQEEPASNILLCRELKRRIPYQTKVVDTSGDSWMAPFSEQLGLPHEEFISWQPVFSSHQSRVLLVEGQIDKEYFNLLQNQDVCGERLDPDIEVVPYGGKDTLKNILLVKFVLQKFDKVYITYDLDADGEVRGSLNRLGLQETKDFLALGINQPGMDCIEGILPQRVLGTVNGRETETVMKLGSRDNSERRKAKDALKHGYLEEFKNQGTFKKDELKEILRLVRIINGNLSRPTP